MAAACGNLSILITASVGGGAVSSHGIFLLNSVPSTTASTLPKGTLFTSIWPASLIVPRGVLKASTASALVPLGPCCNTATVSAALQPGGFGFASIWPNSLINAHSIAKPAATSPLASLGLCAFTTTAYATKQQAGNEGYGSGLNAYIGALGPYKQATSGAFVPLGALLNGATIATTYLPEGMSGFLNGWPTTLIGPMGLRKSATVSAAGPLGMLFDGGQEVPANLPGADSGLAPLTGTVDQGSLGIRVAGTASAMGSLSALGNSATLNQATLSGWDWGAAPLTASYFQGPRGPGHCPTYAGMGSMGPSYLFGLSVSGLITYLSADKGGVILSKTYGGMDKGAASARLTWGTQDQGKAAYRIRFASAEIASATLRKTLASADKGNGAFQATYKGADTGYCLEGFVRYWSVDNGIASCRVAFAGLDKGASKNLATFAAQNQGSAALRKTLLGRDAASAAVFTAFTSVWPNAYITSHGLAKPGIASATAPTGMLCNTATLATARLPGWKPGIGPLTGTRFITSRGLALAATASATGSLGLLFNGLYINLAGFRHAADWGTASLRATYANQDGGVAAQYLTLHSTDGGTAAWPVRYHIADIGQTHGIFTYVAADTGASRQAAAGLAGYTLYRGIDTAPDFTAPWQYSAILPFTTPALASGHTYQFVLRQRNPYGLESQNINAWSLTVSSIGTATNNPSPPTGAALTQTAGLIPLLTASYLPGPDGINAASEWLIYLTTDGTTPNPATSSPVIVAMPSLGGVYQLRYTLPAQTAGTVIKAIVRTRRSGTPNSDSTNTGILSLTLASTGPAAVHGSATFTPNLGDNF